MATYIADLLNLTNEILTAAIVVMAASMLFYNLSRNLRDRVARTSGAALACVTIAYIGDVFISLTPSQQNYEIILRLQWAGIAFIPASLFHLSDALLATTGLPSRGRRRAGVRFLYAVSLVFLILALFTDQLVAFIPVGRVVSQEASTFFPVYIAYFISTTVLAVFTVQRARKRCLTRNTRRRMGYLQFAMLTPAIGIFPYSVLLGPGGEFSLPALVMVNLANAIVILMLIFLSYPLSFFGSRIPDRVVKADLLNFLLRGPATGLLALAFILLIPRVTEVLSIPGEQFMPFAVVAIVLLWQWTIALSLPWLEKVLVYADEDDDNLSKLQTLSDRLLSRGDLLQMLDAILQAVCNYLQVDTAFVAAFNHEHIEPIASVGPGVPTEAQLQRNGLFQSLANGAHSPETLQTWESYWAVPLFSRRVTNEDDQPTLIGVLGIGTGTSTLPDLSPDKREVLSTFAMRTAQTLDDIALQDEIYAALEGLLPQITITRTRAADMEYLPGRERPKDFTLPERDQMIEQVRAALRHYWGGPGLSHSRLIDLQIVQDCLDESDTPVHALRNVLQQAIELQRPEGERKNTDPEWTLYNILDLRFMQGSKVRDVANRLAMSQADLYRKQRIAIEAVADAIAQLERERIQNTPPT